jgi:(2Fe-2S) ferredoxin
MGQYRHHVFVCTSGKTCSEQGSSGVHEAMKKAIKEAGLKHTVRVNHAGCMNQCGNGPMVVVYPQDVWYADVSAAGGRRIVAEHLVGGRPVERYRYHALPGDNKR